MGCGQGVGVKGLAHANPVQDFAPAESMPHGMKEGWIPTFAGMTSLGEFTHRQVSVQPLVIERSHSHTFR